MLDELRKNAEFYKFSKKFIMYQWMNNHHVGETLINNGIDVHFFEDKFASRVFDFNIGIFNGKNDIGNCPVIGVMLQIFRKKKIPLSDVFIICVNLKNAFIEDMLQQNILTTTTFREICEVMDHNFEGVIREYMSLCQQEALSEPKTVDKHTQQSGFNVAHPDTVVLKQTSAIEYLKEIDLDHALLHELHDLESDTLNTIEYEPALSQKTLDESATLFQKYAQVLHVLYEFEELSYALTLLSDLLIATDIATLEYDHNTAISIFLKAIISDLQSWRKAVFVTHEALDIHYLDKTLLSSIAQLQIMIMPHESDHSGDEIAFF